MKKLGIQLLIMFAVVQVYAANYHIKWTQVTGATYDLPTYTITKNVNNSWNNCGAISSNYLKANTDGKVEFVVNNLTEKKAFGLSQYNTAPGLASLDYALYINEGKLFIIENGAILGRYGNVSLNDVVYIERVGSTIYYRQNKTTLRQVSTDPANILYADITIFAQGSSFNSGITASFAVDMSVTYDLVHVNCVTNTRGSISANITGGEAPFTYNWTTGGTSSQITDLKIGKFGVLINDYLGQVFKADFEIFNTTFWNNPTGANFSNDYFTKNTTDGWDNCGGVSYNGLNNGENGYITVKIENTIGNKAIGLSNYSSQTGYLDINYCFFINGPKLDIVESGIVQGTFGTLADGDIVSIELNSGTIFYYLNGKEIRKVVESSSKKLFAKFSVYNQGETLEPVYSSFCFPEIELQSSNVHGQAYCSENVTLIPVGGYPPYSYLWPDGNTSQVRQDVTVGKYDITVSDNYSHSNHNMVAVNTMVQWTDLVGTTLSGEKLVKTGTDGWGTGGAASLNKLYTGENGFLTYTINHLGDVYCLGLSSVNTDANYTSINYGFMIDGSSKIFIYENGILINSVSYAKAGDVLKIEKSGLDIKYYYNGINVLTTNLKNNTDLIVDAAILKTNAYLDPVYVSFCPKPEIITDYTVSFNEDCNLGYADLEVTGGVAPFTYLWSTGETTQDYSNKQGTYYVTVTDYAGTHKTVIVNLIPGIVWTDLVGVELQGDRLVKTAIKDWGNGGAASENMLFADQNGYIVHTVNENNPKSFGLSPSNRDAGYMSIEYSFYISRNGYEIIERGTLIGNYGKYAPGDQLKIEKAGQSIKYWLNNKLIRTTVINDPVNYIADVALFEMGSYFEELYVSFCLPSPMVVDYNITDVSGNDLGSVMLTVTGGVEPYTFRWYKTDINGMIINQIDNSKNSYENIHTGFYKVVVKDAINNSFELDFTIDQKLNWAVLSDIVENNDVLKKTGANGWETGVAQSLNIIPGNEGGFIRFKVLSANLKSAFGLKDASVNDQGGMTGLRNGFVAENGMLSIYLNGVAVRSNFTSISTDDMLSLELINGTLSYYLNGNEVFSSEISEALNYLVHVGLFNLNDEININTYIPYDFPSFSYDVINTTCPDNSDGSIEIIITEGSSFAEIIYEFVSDVNGQTIQSSTDNSISDLEAGCYTVNVIASIDGVSGIVSNTTTYYLCLGDLPVYHAVSGGITIEENGSIVANDFGTRFASENNLLPNQDGIICSFMSDSDKSKYFGLNPIANGYVKYGFEYIAANNNIALIVNGTLSSISFFADPNDRLALIREGAHIKYLHKNTVIYEIACNPAEELFICGYIEDKFNHLEKIISNFCQQCTLIIGPSNNIELCEGGSVQLTFSGAPYFAWENEIIPGVNCTQCPNPIITDEIVPGNYLISSYQDPGHSILCSSFNLGISTIDCEVEQLTGCCFNNFGANVYISSSAYLNVYCNFINETGGTTSYTQEGQFVNKGKIFAKLDWINNANSNLFITNEGITYLFGENQKIKGLHPTHFFDLNLSGFGIKELYVDGYLNGELNLVNSELATKNNVFQVENPDVNAIVRNTGFISTDEAGGYLGRKITGVLNNYLFPMGSTESTFRYRPIEIIPQIEVNNFYKVKFINHDPVADGYSILSPEVLDINNLFYHQILTNSEFEVQVNSYYNPTEDVLFNCLAHWETSSTPEYTSYWDGNFSSTVASGYVSSIHSDFDGEPFVLSNSGFFVNVDGMVDDNEIDSDNDGCPDIADPDIDGDGIANIADSDSDGDGVIDSGSVDSDSDGIIDLADSDADGDGIADEGSTDLNGDGINDDTFSDSDGDGIADIIDVNSTGGNDLDGDGIDDELGAGFLNSINDETGLVVVVTPLTGENDGNLGEPSLGTGDITYYPPTPNTYVMDIIETSVCQTNGKILFTILDDGTVENVTYLDEASLLSGPLSNDLYVLDPIFSGLDLNATPQSNSLSCNPNLSVKFGNTNQLVLSSSEDVILKGMSEISSFTIVFKKGDELIGTFGSELFSSAIDEKILPWAIIESNFISHYPSSNGYCNFILTIYDNEGNQKTMNGQFLINL